MGVPSSYTPKTAPLGYWRAMAVVAAGVLPMMVVLRARRALAATYDDPDSKAPPKAPKKPKSPQQQKPSALSAIVAPATGAMCWYGPVVALGVHEALVHLSFLITGHRGEVQAGTWLKVFLDSKDVVSHSALAVTAPPLLSSLLHTGLLGWHTAKAVDSNLIEGYSPMRGLFTPNLVDTLMYTSSAILGGLEQPAWGATAAAVYLTLRFGFNAVY